MNRSNRGAGVAILILAAMCAMGVAIAQNEEEEYIDSPDFVAQKATSFKIYIWGESVVAFMREFPGHELPGTLQTLDGALGGSKPEALMLIDGWGRPLVYFVTQDGHYVIASFGKNGVPEGQAAKPGGVTPDMDRDADIVLIDGEWAQKPGGVCGLS